MASDGRNVFDQYQQPENRLTHALVSTLTEDSRLIRPFLKWLKIPSIPRKKDIKIGQQQVPGQRLQADKEGEQGLPDACLFDDKGWAVLVECKVQAAISVSQLHRHRKTASRYGFDNVTMVLVTVDKHAKNLPAGCKNVLWRDIYSWFCLRKESQWAKRFTDYMEIFESKMTSDDYNIKGALTMFTGFHFDDDNPYTYRQGKRIIRIAMEECRKNRKLLKCLRLDPRSEGRSAITSGEDESVWDFIGLKQAAGHIFTNYPHATMVVRSNEVSVAITIPNGYKGGLKSKLKTIGLKEYESMLLDIENQLRPIIRKVPGMKPMLYALQRHYKSQRSNPVMDGKLEVDLRALVGSRNQDVKRQPMWTEAIYNILTHKRANIQMGIEVHLPYEAKVMRTPKALDVICDSWITLKPLLDFVLA